MWYNIHDTARARQSTPPPLYHPCRVPDGGGTPLSSHVSVALRCWRRWCVASRSAGAVRARGRFRARKMPDWSIGGPRRCRRCCSRITIGDVRDAGFKNSPRRLYYYRRRRRSRVYTRIYYTYREKRRTETRQPDLFHRWLMINRIGFSNVRARPYFCICVTRKKKKKAKSFPFTVVSHRRYGDLWSPACTVPVIYYTAYTHTLLIIHDNGVGVSNTQHPYSLVHTLCALSVVDGPARRPKNIGRPAKRVFIFRSV